MNATGESDVRLWYDTIQGRQATILRPRTERLLRLLWLAKDGPTGGVEPQAWSHEYHSLWQSTPSEQAALRKAVAETDAIMITQRVVTPEQVARARYGGARWSDALTLTPEEIAAVQAAQAPTGPSLPMLPAAGAEEGQPVPQAATVQETAMNGVQVASLRESLREVASGSLPPQTVRALISAAFPAVPAQLVAEMFEGLKGFTPSQPAEARADQMDMSSIDDVIEALRPERLTGTQKFVRSVMLDEGNLTLRGLGGMAGQFDMLNPRTIRFLLDYQNTKIKGIHDTTKQIVREALVEGVREGEGIRDLEKRIKAVMIGNDNRFRVIARTEAISAANFGTFEAYKMSGLVSRKRWISSGNLDPRPEHQALNGTTVGIDEEFVTSDGARALYPGGFGDPKHDIQCGCTIVAAFDTAATDSADGTQERMDDAASAREARLELYASRIEAGFREAFRAQLDDVNRALREAAR
jgi:SPP1 gp7 family putative phage head morphogenesis protein